jgi:hypothetical protein
VWIVWVGKRIRKVLDPLNLGSFRIAAGFLFDRGVYTFADASNAMSYMLEGIRHDLQTVGKGFGFGVSFLRNTDKAFLSGGSGLSIRQVIHYGG